MASASAVNISAPWTAVTMFAETGATCPFSTASTALNMTQAISSKRNGAGDASQVAGRAGEAAAPGRFSTSDIPI